ncbi:6-phosphogluconolactonase [Pseudohyphozyma bogoriensis]|nr:6-phosphogluconolactonase [Pseudohyphozyma bogoriensis]
MFPPGRLATNHIVSQTPPISPGVTHPLSPPDTVDSFAHSPTTLDPARPPAHELQQHSDSEAYRREQEQAGYSRYPIAGRRGGQNDREAGGRVATGGLSYRTGGVVEQSSDGGEQAGKRKKWLVLVVPPQVLPHSPPPVQLSAQLSLIAREYSLPSIGGLSLYLCLPPDTSASHGFQPQGFAFGSSSASESGAKPRIVDEIWSVLFEAYLSRERSWTVQSAQGMNGLPIAAKLEFDVSPTKARWLEPWLAATTKVPKSATLSEPEHVGTMSRGAHLRTGSAAHDVDVDESSPLRYRSQQHWTTNGGDQTVPGGAPTTLKKPAGGRRPLSLLHRATSSIASNPMTSTPSHVFSTRAAPPPLPSPIDVRPARSNQTSVDVEVEVHDSGFGSTASPVPSGSEGSAKGVYLATDDESEWPATPPSPDRQPSPDLPERLMSFTPSALGFAKIPDEPRRAPLLSTPGPTRRLIERDWECKVKPLCEVSGTPTPLATSEGFASSQESKLLESPPRQHAITSGYPNHLLQLYPAVYPNFSLYPAFFSTIIAPTAHRSVEARRLEREENVETPRPDKEPPLHVETTNPATYPFHLSQTCPSVYPHFDKLYPTISVEIFRAAPPSAPDISDPVPPQLQVPIELQRHATARAGTGTFGSVGYPHNLVIYPAPQTPLPSKYRAPKPIPPPLVLVEEPSPVSRSSSTTPASPERLESASLEDRVLGSAKVSTSSPPPLQYPLYGTSDVEIFDAYARFGELIERDDSIPMVSLEDASLPSPMAVEVHEEEEAQEGSFGVDQDDLPDILEGRELSDWDYEGTDSPDSPDISFSSKFIPPPDSPAFDFASPSPTLNALQINSSYEVTSSSLSDGHSLPFVLSPRLGAALEAADQDATRSFGDEFSAVEDDEGDSRFVVTDEGGWEDDTEELEEKDMFEGVVPTDPDAPPVVHRPVLFSFPATKEADDLSAAVGQFVVEAQMQSIERRGRFCIALSGGSMPAILAEALLNDERVLWDKWEIFFTDEKLVPLSSPESTFKQYDDALFSKLPQLPSWRIHTIQSLPELQQDESISSDACEEITQDYEQQLTNFFPECHGPGVDPDPPRFDLILLGLGEDGETASLFPGHSASDEEDWWITFLTDAPKPPSSRITFTLPLLCAARRLAFIATGRSESVALANVLDQDIPDEEKLPAARVALYSHPVVVFADSEASHDTSYAQSLFWEEE